MRTIHTHTHTHLRGFNPSHSLFLSPCPPYLCLFDCFRSRGYRDPPLHKHTHCTHTHCKHTHCTHTHCTRTHTICTFIRHTQIHNQSTYSNPYHSHTHTLTHNRDL